MSKKMRKTWAKWAEKNPTKLERLILAWASARPVTAPEPEPEEGTLMPKPKKAPRKYTFVRRSKAERVPRLSKHRAHKPKK